jgi:hypothetical protein
VSLHFSFLVGCLPLEISAPGSFAENVLKLVAPFQTTEPDRFRLNIKLRTKKSFHAKETVVPLPTEAHWNYLYISNWSKDGLELTLKKNTPLILSAAICCFLSKTLTEHNGLLLHACMLVRDGVSCLFLGPSGAGKSTLARNASHMQCVHDDKVAVRRIGNKFFAQGVPMLDNHKRTGKNILAPIHGIYFIEKSDRLRVLPLRPSTILEKLPSQVILPYRQKKILSSAFSTMASLATSVKCYQLKFGKRSDVSDAL